MEYTGPYGAGIALIPREEINDFKKGPWYPENKETRKEHQESMYLKAKNYEARGVFKFDIDFLKTCGFDFTYEE